MGRVSFDEVAGRIKLVIVKGFICPIKFDGEKFWHPFISKNGLPIYRRQFSDITNSLEGCLKDEEFADQKKKLQADGVIISIEKAVGFYARKSMAKRRAG